MQKTFLNEMIFDLPAPYTSISLFHRIPCWFMDEHNHAFYQVIFVTAGTLVIGYRHQNYVLKKGQVAIIPPYHPHSLYSPDGYLQLGIDLQIQKDERGLLSLLEANVTSMLILNQMNFVNGVYELTKECKNLTALNRLKTAKFLDDILLSGIESYLAGEGVDFKNQFLRLFDRDVSYKITLAEICTHLSISKTQLERLVNKEFGCSAIEYYHKLKVSKACALLADPNISIKHIADYLGFYDEAHFSRFFKKKIKMSPNQYRKERIGSPVLNGE